MPRGAYVRRKRKSTIRLAAALCAAALALSACAAFSGQARRAPGDGPRIAAQRPNPPTMLRAQREETRGVFSWAPARQGAQPSFYYLTIEPMDGAMAPIGPVRIAATGTRLETMQAFGPRAGATLARWSVRACNDEPVPALHGAPPGNCSLPASSVLSVADRPGAASLATFTIGSGPTQS